MNPSDLPIGRREFVAASAALAAGALVPRLFASAPPKPGLIVLNARPLAGETPLSAMASWRTPNDLFFVRSHFGPPAPSAEPWTLAIDGEVSHPLTLSLDEIRRLPATTRAVTLECAGNGRGLFSLPNTSGIQWTRGAVSNAEWTGVPLATVLERAGLNADAAHVWTEAADRAPLGVPKFLRSIPRQVAMEHAFLAWEMNGEPIPQLHGGPLRLLVPGWFGMASTKWLTHLHVRKEPSDNHFMARGYRYPDGSPVEAMRVKSVIAEPTEGASVRAGRVRVAGVAWTGTGSVQRVEVSSDGGRTWMEARLTGPEQVGAWRTWEHTLQLEPGRHALQVRATDGAGATQPAAATPNPAGYANNSIHEVRIDATR